MKTKRKTALKKKDFLDEHIEVKIFGANKELEEKIMKQLKESIAKKLK